MACFFNLISRRSRPLPHLLLLQLLTHHRPCWHSRMSYYYLLPGTNQPSPAPVDLAGLQSLISQGTLTAESLVWGESLSEWTAISKVLTTAPAPARAPVRGAVAAAAAVRTGVTKEDITLAKFEAELAEIAGIGAPIEPNAPIAGGGEDSDRKPSPDPEDREFEDDDGTRYLWDSTLRSYVPQPDGTAAAAAAAAATFTAEDMVFPDSAPAPLPPFFPPPAAAAAAAHFSADTSADPDADDERGAAPAVPSVGAKRKGKAVKEFSFVKKAKKDEVKEPKAAVVTSVYVTGLPPDTTVQEVKEVFAKCGIIREDEDGTPKIRLYADKESGELKGDGLVHFLKEPSVGLAIQLLDQAPLRPGDARLMTVTKAEFNGGGAAARSGRSTGAAPAGAAAAGVGAGAKAKRGGGGGGGGGAHAIEKKLGWGGFDDNVRPEDVTVVLRNVFHPDDFIGAPEGRAELEKDMRGECGKLGMIDRVKVYMSNEEGIVTVRFLNPTAALLCAQKMEGRFYAGRRIVAHLWDGKETFVQAGPGGGKRRETKEEEEARLEKFSRELEAAAEAVGP